MSPNDRGVQGVSTYIVGFIAVLAAVMLFVHIVLGAQGA